MSNNSRSWTPSEDEALRKMWAEKTLVREIAKVLHRTRSSIVGRAHRLHLERRENPVKNRKYYVHTFKSKPTRPAPVKKPPKRIDHPWAAKVAPDQRDAAVIYDGPPVADPMPGVGGHWSCCQFIAGDPAGSATLYCGRPTARPTTVYCDWHYRICYTPSKPKTEKPHAP